MNKEGSYTKKDLEKLIELGRAEYAEGPIQIKTGTVFSTDRGWICNQ